MDYGIWIECLVLFFYCKHQQQEKCTFAGILRGLLAQLLRKADAALMSWFGQRCLSLDRQKLESLEILEELATFAFNSQHISLVVLDGLDECNHEEIRKIISWFVSHQGAHTGTGQIRVICIGQRTDILQSMLSSATSISLDNSHHQNDIEKYVVGKSRNIQRIFKIKLDIVSQIVSRVMKTAKGLLLKSFLILKFYILHSNSVARNVFICKISNGKSPKATDPGRLDERTSAKYFPRRT